MFIKFISRIANGPASRGVNLGGLAGQWITQHRKKFHFCIIQAILYKINIKIFELDGYN